MQRQNISLIIFIILLLAVGYIWYSYSRSQPSPEATSIQTVQTSLRDINRLKDIKLDVSIFQDKFFEGLNTAPPAESAPPKPGRGNPFLPF